MDCGVREDSKVFESGARVRRPDTAAERYALDAAHVTSRLMQYNGIFDQFRSDCENVT